MFSRILTLHLKPDAIAELAGTVEKQIVPLLKEQEGFREHVFFVRADGSEATAISFWNCKENADEYARSAYAKVLDALTYAIDGVPRAKSFEVVSSTFKTVAPIVAF